MRAIEAEEPLSPNDQERDLVSESELEEGKRGKAGVQVRYKYCFVPIPTAEPWEDKTQSWY